jgi:hypothetical protein
MGSTSRHDGLTVCPKVSKLKWDLQDVLNAHAVVAINPEEYRNSGTGGRHVELGYAIAHSIPVFILGCRSHVFHDMCDLIDNETVLIAALHASPASFSYRHHVQSLRAMFAPCASRKSEMVAAYRHRRTIGTELR